MAPVKIIAVYRCFNLNTQKLEQLLHKFFGKSCLNIDIYGSDGRRYTPREWFIAPIDVIEKVIELMISGEIINYRYDDKKESIVKK